MVAFWPERAVTDGAVIRSVPFFWARPRMIICTWPSENSPVSAMMPGATLALWAVRFGLLRMASMLLRLIAWSPQRRPLVTILESRF